MGHCAAQAVLVAGRGRWAGPFFGLRLTRKTRCHGQIFEKMHLYFTPFIATKYIALSPINYCANGVFCYINFRVQQQCLHAQTPLNLKVQRRLLKNYPASTAGRKRQAKPCTASKRLRCAACHAARNAATEGADRGQEQVVCSLVGVAGGLRIVRFCLFII